MSMAAGPTDFFHLPRDLVVERGKSAAIQGAG
jgi:hypothetical protein